MDPSPGWPCPCSCSKPLLLCPLDPGDPSHLSFSPHPWTESVLYLSDHSTCRLPQLSLGPLTSTLLSPPWDPPTSSPQPPWDRPPHTSPVSLGPTYKPCLPGRPLPAALSFPPPRPSPQLALCCLCLSDFLPSDLHTQPHTLSPLVTVQLSHLLWLPTNCLWGFPHLSILSRHLLGDQSGPAMSRPQPMSLLRTVSSSTLCWVLGLRVGRGTSGCQAVGEPGGLKNQGGGRDRNVGGGVVRKWAPARGMRGVWGGAGLFRQAGGRSGGGCVEPCPAGWIRTEHGGGPSGA